MGTEWGLSGINLELAPAS